MILKLNKLMCIFVVAERTNSMGLIQKMVVFSQINPELQATFSL